MEVWNMKTNLQLSPFTLQLELHWLDQFHSFLENDYRKVTHHQLSDKSIKNAIQHIRKFGLWHEAQFKETFEPGTLTNYAIHLYRKVSLEQEKVMAATWNSRHWALGIFCTFIGLPELMDGIEQKEQGRASTKHRSLTDNEYHLLVRTLEHDTRNEVLQAKYNDRLRNRAAVALMLHAGLRVEEVSLLFTADVTIGERSGEVLIRNGKGCKQRAVRLNLIARQSLVPWLDLKSDSASLINLTTRSLERIVKEIGQRIGIPDLTPHWLRYTVAKRLEKAGEPIETIRDVLGHKSIDVTRRYLRSSMEDIQSAMEKIV
jgi:integrase/recombinase XerD